MTEPATRRTRRFGPSGAELFAALVLLCCALPLASTSRWLVWLVLVPVACAVWVLRARVVVSEDGLEVCNGLATHHSAWSAVEGFRVPRRGPVRLLRHGRRPLLMTALPRRELPGLRKEAEDLGRPRA